ncbi:hypothetical protein [Streptomyces sp. NPDC002690]
MHGYGYPPELPPARPSSATLTALRVVFVALTVLSCGLLAWAAMLRLAIVTRRPRDWVLFVVSIALVVGFCAFLGTVPSDEDAELTDGQAVVVLLWILVTFGGVPWYYLHQDIRHFGPNGPNGPRAAGARPAVGYPVANPAQGYGYPPAVPQPPVYGAPPVTPHPQGPTPPYGAVPPQPHQPLQQQRPTPPPRRPGPPQRLDQVRAELDELSDYLRKEGEGR